MISLLLATESIFASGFEDSLPAALTGAGTLGAAIIAIMRILRSDKDWREIISAYRDQIVVLEEGRVADRQKHQSEVEELEDDIRRLKKRVRELEEQIRSMQDDERFNSAS